MATFEHVRTPIAVTDLTGRVVDANAAYCALVRRGPDQVIGAEALPFIHPDDWFPLVADVLSLIEGRVEHVENQHRHLRPDGTEVQMTVTVSLLHREGEPALVVNEIGRHQEVASSDDLVLARAQAIHDAVQEGVSLHDVDGRLVAVTTQVEHLLGRTSQQLLGRRWTDPSLRPIGPGGDALARSADDPVQEAIERGRVVERTVGVHRPDGALVWVAVKATPLPGGGAVSALGDLTALVTAEEDRARLAGIVHRTTDLVFMWGRAGTLTYVNETARQVLGLTLDDDPSETAITALFPTSNETRRSSEVLTALWRLGRWTGDAELHTPAGRRMPVSVVVLAEQDEQRRFTRFSAVAHDLTSRVQLEVELQRRATRDPLTGLANRWMLHDQLNCFLSGGGASVVYLDLDGFKVVNDVHGHAAGDQVLIDVARCLQDLAPPEALVCRPGGDEFVVVLPSGMAAERLLDVLPEALARFGVQVSAGVATALEGDDAAGLLARADAAMYRVKGRPSLACRSPLAWPVP